MKTFLPREGEEGGEGKEILADGWTDGPIKGSTRGPRRPKNEKLNCFCKGPEVLFKETFLIHNITGIIQCFYRNRAMIVLKGGINKIVHGDISDVDDFWQKEESVHSGCAITAQYCLTKHILPILCLIYISP